MARVVRDFCGTGIKFFIWKMPKRRYPTWPSQPCPNPQTRPPYHLLFRPCRHSIDATIRRAGHQNRGPMLGANRGSDIFVGSPHLARLLGSVSSLGGSRADRGSNLSRRSSRSCPRRKCATSLLLFDAPGRVVSTRAAAAFWRAARPGHEDWILGLTT